MSGPGEAGPDEPASAEHERSLNAMNEGASRLGKAAAGDVTLVEVMELLVPLGEFERLIGAAVRRLEVEGVRELVTMQFYADPESTEAGAVITFSDRRRMIDHMTMISGWDEFKAYARSCRLTDMRVYGILPPEAEEWITAFGKPSKRFPRHVVGFARRGHT